MKDLEAIRPSAIVDLVSSCSRFTTHPPFALLDSLVHFQPLKSPMVLIGFVSPSRQIYSGEAMAASLNLRGRRAGGDPDPYETSNAPPKKGITKATKKGAKQVQREFFIVSSALCFQNDMLILLFIREYREMPEMSIAIVSTVVSSLHATRKLEQGSCEDRCWRLERRFLVVGTHRQQLSISHCTLL